MTDLSDELIIRGIRDKDRDVLQYMYKHYYPMVDYMIRNNNGARVDARDVFQDSLVIVFQKVKADNFHLTCSFKTYLYSICKNLWMKHLEKNNRMLLIWNDLENSLDISAELNASIREVEKDKLVHRHLLQMSENCQKILLMTIKKFSARQIAEAMGFSSQQYARKRKSLCIKALIKSIQSDPAYKTLQDHEKK